MPDSGGERVRTGVDGLDEILHGGLIPERSYMVRGEPGTGKSILGLHFLIAGTEQGETSLYINLEETETDITQNAASLGLDVSDVEFLDLTPESTEFTEEETYDVFSPDDVEREPVTETITDRVRELDPDRVVIDPMTQLQYLAPDQYQFRKQVLSLTRFFGQTGATLVFTSQAGARAPDDDLQFMSDGVIELDYTDTGRTVSVPKFRGSGTRSGDHTMRIRDTGTAVYPELQPGGSDVEYAMETISSGVPELDQQLHGGIERGTVTIISGPTGVGKTTTGAQFMKEAAGRGERSAIYMFEETERTFLKRCSSVNIPVAAMRDRGTLSVEEVQALELSPQEFAHKVRTDVEEEDTQIVMIDGINGYDLSIRGDDSELRRKLHSLCRYLKSVGVTVILIDEVSSVTGEFEVTEGGISYIADNIVFLRHIEMNGELRKVIGVLKKRTSDFERTLRNFRITEHGITIGEPLTNLRGILQGTPEWTDDESK
ncbi:ATPase domain-containing protein [Halopenitus persicus]|uniref:ATPase domain-containing protein n=1 Tax=Halopenitus persicus TaxID=1048396 RepID=UPI0015606A18|nr:ATPase domain-containing protein [Halopenitus persicus]